MNDNNDAAPAAEATEAKEPPKRRPWWRRLIRSVTRIVVIAYVAAVLLLTSCQSRLMYYPSRPVTLTPDAVGLTYEDVKFTTDDGVNLHGWFVPAAQAAGTVLFCHGNAGNIADRVYSIDTFHQLGYAVFIFDYRGFGRSAGKPSEAGTYSDAEAAWNYLTDVRKTPAERIVIFGRSLGGSIATHLAKDHTPGRLIVESTFSTAADVAAAHFWFLPARWMIRYNYDTVAYIRAVHCPVLVVHSGDDEVVPYDLGRKVFQAANEPKTFLEINGGHNNGFFVSSSTYVRGLRAFLEKSAAAADRPDGSGRS